MACKCNVHDMHVHGGMALIACIHVHDMHVHEGMHGFDGMYMYMACIFLGIESACQYDYQSIITVCYFNCMCHICTHIARQQVINIPPATHTHIKQLHGLTGVLNSFELKFPGIKSPLSWLGMTVENTTYIHYVHSPLTNDCLQDLGLVNSVYNCNWYV